MLVSAAKLVRAVVMLLAIYPTFLKAETPAPDLPFVYAGTWNGYPYGYGYFDSLFWPTWGGAYVMGYAYAYPRVSYGVIAYSLSADKSGFAWGADSIASARANALDFCGDPTCKPIVWVHGGCASIAVSKERHSLGWAYAENRDDATWAARRACVQSGGVGCSERTWVCSF